MELNSKLSRNVKHFKKLWIKLSLAQKIPDGPFFCKILISVHKSAKQMQHIDALSRYPVMLTAYYEIAQKSYLNPPMIL